MAVAPLAPSPRKAEPLAALHHGGGVLCDVTNFAGPRAGSGKLAVEACAEPRKRPERAGKPPPGSPPCASPARTPVNEVPAVGADGSPREVEEYVHDIYLNLRQSEARSCQREATLRTPAGYMEQQPHINAKMRAILMDWLVDVHKRYKLRPETLFLAVTLVDSYLAREVVARKHLQLVGVTALFIAAKFEDQYPPQINELVFVTDKAYTKEEVLKMEVAMLRALDFNICAPTAMHFLDRYQRVNGCTEEHRHLAHYLAELSLVEYKMVKFAPSHIAAAALWLSNKLLRKQPSWSSAMVRLTELSESQLKDCAKELCGLLERADTSQLQAVRNKFSHNKYRGVAKLDFLVGLVSKPVAGEVQGRAKRQATSRRCATVPEEQDAVMCNDENTAPPTALR